MVGAVGRKCSEKVIRVQMQPVCRNKHPFQTFQGGSITLARPREPPSSNCAAPRKLRKRLIARRSSLSLFLSAAR
jgi:hypothetical protein